MLTSLQWLQTEFEWASLKSDKTDPPLKDHDSLTWFRANPQRFQEKELLQSDTCACLTINPWCTQLKQHSDAGWMWPCLSYCIQPSECLPTCHQQRVRDYTHTTPVISLSEDTIQPLMLNLTENMINKIKSNKPHLWWVTAATLTGALLRHQSSCRHCKVFKNLTQRLTNEISVMLWISL